MGKYSESVGIWKHEIAGVVNEIKPEEEDNLNFMEIKKKAELAKDELILTKGVGDLYFNMVTRSDKALSEEDKKELRTMISMNISQIITDVLIKFKWTTQEKLDDMEKRQMNIQEEIQKKKMLVEPEKESLKS